MDPKLEHFVVRPNMEDDMPGPIVPLIAVDQLPDWMQLVGVPRELDAEQTIGLTNLGIVDKEDDSVFEVRLHHDRIRAILNSKMGSDSSGPDSSGPGNDKAEATVKKETASAAKSKTKAIEKAASEESLSTSADTSSTTRPGPVERPAPRVHLGERMLSASRHNVANTAMDIQPHSNNERPLRPHMTEATRGELRPTAPQRTTAKQDKQPATAFCRHWCLHGTCKWGLECRYQHRMPATVEGLREVGLKDFPTWYLLMMGGNSGGIGIGIGSGLPGLFSMDTMLGKLGDAQPSARRRPPAQEQQQQPPQPPIQHHAPDPPSLDLRLAQGRMSALLAPGSAVSDGQKLRQIREMRQLLLRGAAPAQQQRRRPHSNRNYANLYTNASVAANAGSIRRQAERQKQARDNMPVATRARAVEGVETGPDSGACGGDGGGGVLPARGGGRASDDHADVRNGSLGVVAARAGVGEEKLVDID
ncbi:hypothetical protein UCDDA912_g08400 [Diaporthe ampelina]|uniref:C3H1-type domain-containing protein n=1 Tax=Diaporthe ampelina TaxID=1214573 RepID=A0A0G2FBZ0_9PEZI|nr:hypothetical protein UCDDA912_g08400 [Diaporthe ampelina]